MKRVFTIIILERCSTGCGNIHTAIGEITVSGKTLQKAVDKAKKVAKENYEIADPVIGSIECVEGFFNDNLTQGETK